MQRLQAGLCAVTFVERAGLKTGENSDDGDYTAVWWRWFLQSAAGPADRQLDERAVEVWLRSCAQHGHRGLHLRDAAGWCALGIHPARGRGGHLQTFLSLPGIYKSTYLSVFLGVRGSIFNKVIISDKTELCHIIPDLCFLLEKLWRSHKFPSLDYKFHIFCITFLLCFVD